MLTLTRKVGQKLVIGDSVCIEIVSISGKQVAVGITAPDDVKIYREEIAPQGLMDKILGGLRSKFPSTP